MRGKAFTVFPYQFCMACHPNGSRLIVSRTRIKKYQNYVAAQLFPAKAFQANQQARHDALLAENTMSPWARISRSRIESLSDIIFGLALAISTVPLISRTPSRPFGMIIDISEFGFGFLILISVWIGYTNTMSVLPVENSTVVNLNLLLLFLVSIEPYLFYLNITYDLVSHELFLNLASILYALDMTGLMLILGLFSHQLAREEKGLVPKDSMVGFKRVRDALFVSSALFALTVLPIFWVTRIYGQPIRFYFWFIPLLLSFSIRISNRNLPVPSPNSNV